MVTRDTKPGVCTECGADLPKGARRCPDCRAVVQGAPAPQGQLTHDTIVEKSLMKKLKQDLNVADVSPLLKPTGIAKSQRIDSGGIPMVSAKLITPRLQDQRGGSKPRDITAQPTHIEHTPPMPQAPLQPRSPRSLAEDSMADTAPPAPIPTRGGGGGPRTIGLVAVELEDALEGAVQSWSRMDLADRITMLSSFGLIICTFLPWFGGHMGILGGGGTAWLFAVGAIALVVLRGGRRRQAEADLPAGVGRLKSDPASLRRLNLLQILVGVGAVLYTLLLALGHYLSEGERFQVSYGWYLALFLAMGLAYSGIARFTRDARR